jgi:DMSO reductase anchor subunit
MTILFFFSLAWLLDLQFGRKPNERLRTIVGWVAITLGVGAIYCMAQIYRLPTQIAWDNFNMVLSFFLDTFMLGVMALSLLLIMDVTYSRLRGFGYVDTQSQVIQHALPWLALAAIILGGLILAENAFQMSFLQLTNNSTAQASLQLIKRIYPVLYILRIVLILVGASGLVAAIAWKIRWVKSIGDLLAPAYITCLLVMIGAILGRFLFYATHVRIGI